MRLFAEGVARFAPLFQLCQRRFGRLVGGGIILRRGDHGLGLPRGREGSLGILRPRRERAHLRFGLAHRPLQRRQFGLGGLQRGFLISQRRPLRAQIGLLRLHLRALLRE